MSSTEFPSSFVEPWKELLQSHRDEQQNDFPNNHVDDWDKLISSSVPRNLFVGTGYTIYSRSLLPAILSAKHSVQLITCFWASSPSLDGIRDTLLELAATRSQSGNTKNPLRISIGFSSSGLFQKIFHTSSRDGYVYPPSKWPTLGLLEESTLKKGGIELTVKSLFFTPFSVMHPKFVIVDGCRAWIPSCNVSWERWFEGCVEVEGDIVTQLMSFYKHVWATLDETLPLNNVLSQTSPVPNGSSDTTGLEALPTPSPNRSRSIDIASATQEFSFPQDEAVPTIFLPSSHHRNPRFSIFPFLSQSNPPMTPLNAALSTLITNAQRRITILTPNVTSWPVIDALLAALARGVDVQIRTSKNMMLIEQLVTAGTTTSWCLARLIKKYRALLDRKQTSDEERQTMSTGNLEIFYYKPLESRKQEQDEPVVSHFKMTLVDEEYLVLGSGNMDRASWWTSQEIGLLFYVPGFEGYKLWEDVLGHRAEVVFQSRDLRT